MRELVLTFLYYGCKMNKNTEKTKQTQKKKTVDRS